MPLGVPLSSIPASALHTLYWRPRSFGLDASRKRGRRPNRYSSYNPRSLSVDLRSLLDSRQPCTRRLPKRGARRVCRRNEGGFDPVEVRFGSGADTRGRSQDVCF